MISSSIKTWPEVTSDPRFIAADYIKRNKIRARYVSNYLLPYAQAQEADPNVYIRKFLDRTYDDIGFPAKPKGIETEQDKQAGFAYSFARGLVNEALLNAFKPITDIGVKPSETTGEKIAETAGRIAAYITPGAPVKIIMGTVGKIAGKALVKKIGEKALEKGLARILPHIVADAAGFGAAMAAMEPEGQVPLWKSIAELGKRQYADPQAINNILSNIKARAIPAVEGVATGAAFGIAGPIQKATIRIPLMASAGAGTALAMGATPEQAAVSGAVGAIAGIGRTRLGTMGTEPPYKDFQRYRAPEAKTGQEVPRGTLRPEETMEVPPEPVPEPTLGPEVKRGEAQIERGYFPEMEGQPSGYAGAERAPVVQRPGEEGWIEYEHGLVLKPTPAESAQAQAHLLSPEVTWALKIIDERRPSLADVKEARRILSSPEVDWSTRITGGFSKAGKNDVKWANAIFNSQEMYEARRVLALPDKSAVDRQWAEAIINSPEMHKAIDIQNREAAFAIEGLGNEPPAKTIPSIPIKQLKPPEIIRPGTQEWTGAEAASDNLMKYGLRPPDSYSPETIKEAGQSKGYDPAKIEAKLAEPIAPVESASQMADAIQSDFDQGRLQLKALTKPTIKKIITRIAKELYEPSPSIKAELANSGEWGQNVIYHQNAVRGAGTRALAEYAAWNKAALRPLSRIERKALGDYRAAKNFVQVVERHGDSYRLPNVRSIEDYKAYLKTFEQRVGSESYQKILAADNATREVAFNLLKRRLQSGLITSSSYEAMMQNYDYNPILFLQHLDEAVEFRRGSEVISTTKSGIKSIEEGSFNNILTDPKQLISQLIYRTNAQIARNEADQALLAFVEKVPDNGFVRRRMPAEKDKVPTGWSNIGAMVEGQKREMLMRDDMAKEWITSRPEMSRNLSRFFNIVSGSFIIRPMATGINPMFAIGNTLRDIQHLYLYEDQGYSKLVPIFLGQYARDAATVWRDVVHQRGRYLDNINEGGGFTTLTKQGVGPITDAIPGVSGLGYHARNLMGYLGWANEFSEMLTRIAHRERLIRSGASPFEATQRARARMDFNISGGTAKAIDSFVPYFNAQIQATRGLARAAKKDPALFAFKAAQLGAISYGLYYANNAVNPEAYKQVSERAKISNWVFTTPFYKTDNEGKKHYLIGYLPKDQVSQIITTLFESAARWAHEDRPPSNEVFMALDNAFRIMPTEYISPALQAFAGYMMNKDFWRNEDIWKGGGSKIKPELEAYPNTPAFYKRFGKTTGLSPVRSQYWVERFTTIDNAYSNVVGYGIKQLLKELPDEDQSELSKSILNNPVIGKRFLRYGSSKDYEANERLEKIEIEENSRRKVQSDQLKTLYTSKGKSFTNSWIGQQPIEDRQRLQQRLERMDRNKGVDDFYIQLAEANPISRASYYFQNMSTLNEADKRKLESDTRHIQGFWTPDFIRALNRLKEEARKLK